MSRYYIENEERRGATEAFERPPPLREPVEQNATSGLALYAAYSALFCWPIANAGIATATAPPATQIAAGVTSVCVSAEAESPASGGGATSADFAVEVDATIVDDVAKP